MVEKILMSDILRGLIDAGYGVNNKLLKYTEINYLKIINVNKIFSIIF